MGSEKSGFQKTFSGFRNRFSKKWSMYEFLCVNLSSKKKSASEFTNILIDVLTAREKRPFNFVGICPE
jgi:hypothetical protein